MRFQIFIHLKRKDAEHIVAALNWLDLLCEGRFKDFFGLLLADRGSEFDEIFGIEHDLDGKKRCDIYYADPRRPDQKGGCEKNHVELRKVILKGISIDSLDLDPWLMAGICSHVNSSLRDAIGDACPASLAKTCLPASLLEGLGVDVIDPDDVILTPDLIEKLNVDRPNNQIQ